MDHPLERPVPTGTDERIKEFARDLAWGVENKQWENAFPVFFMQGIHSEESWLPPPQIYLPNLTTQRIDFTGLLRDKWDNKPPTSDHIVSQGFLEWNDADPTSPLHVTPFQRVASVTDKGLKLLNPDPVTTLKVFISYKQSTSCAFALLIEARIKELDPNITVFIDKEIQPGSDLRREILSTIRDYDTLICIYSPETPRSDYVNTEVNFALNLGHNVIPVWHLGYKGEGRYPDGLSGLRRVEVSNENTKSYENALEDLLNALRRLVRQN